MGEEKIDFNKVIVGRLQGQELDMLYACIADMLECSIDIARFPEGDAVRLLHHQDVTKFLASWSRHVGLSEEETAAWLIDYSVAAKLSISQRLCRLSCRSGTSHSLISSRGVIGC